MAQKTMLRQLISKWGIMSIDLQTAIDKDMSVIHEDGTAEYVENEETAENVVAEQEMQEVDTHTPGKTLENHSEETSGTQQMSMEEAFFH